jgi:hypothetical protein
VRKVTAEIFDPSKTARNQSQEALEAIKAEVRLSARLLFTCFYQTPQVRKNHRELLQGYDREWPLDVLILAYIENKQSYQRVSGHSQVLLVLMYEQLSAPGEYPL